MPARKDPQTLRNTSCVTSRRTITLGTRRRPLVLPALYWDMLMEICAREGLSLTQVCYLVDNRRGQAKFTQAVRALVVEYYRAAATRKADAPADLVTEILDTLF